MHKNIIEVVEKIVEVLVPLSSEERQRAVKAALVLIGETKIKPEEDIAGEDTQDTDDFKLPVRARTWMKQNNVTLDQIQQVFHFVDGNIEVIASEIPGKSGIEKTCNAYVFSGIAGLLVNGEAKFTDEAARAICKTSGFYDETNHAKRLKEKGNKFTGSKEKGWALTAPGLKSGAELILEITSKK